MRNIHPLCKLENQKFEEYSMGNPCRHNGNLPDRLK
jgi:hypothetical protein